MTSGRKSFVVFKSTQKRRSLRTKLKFLRRAVSLWVGRQKGSARRTLVSFGAVFGMWRNALPRRRGVLWHPEKRLRRRLTGPKLTVARVYFPHKTKRIFVRSSSCEPLRFCLINSCWWRPVSRRLIAWVSGGLPHSWHKQWEKCCVSFITEISTEVSFHVLVDMTY